MIRYNSEYVLFPYQWHFGILVFWYFGILAFWLFGILAFWHFGTLQERTLLK
jgi:hypothetical protein